MSNYYTGRGDDGISRIGLKKINKTNLMMTALGDLDELNSLLGLVKCRCGLYNKKTFQNIIENIQESLFIIQAHLASGMFEKLYKPPQFSKEKIVALEKEIAQFEKKLNPTRKFIISGANEEAAWLDFARAIARRAERSILQFSKKEKITPEIFAYCNRLSSILFVMARIAAKNSKEKNPQYR